MTVERGTPQRHSGRKADTHVVDRPVTHPGGPVQPWAESPPPAVGREQRWQRRIVLHDTDHWTQDNLGIQSPVPRLAGARPTLHDPAANPHPAVDRTPPGRWDQGTQLGRVASRPPASTIDLGV